jgi:hypothetical protein
LNPDDQHLIGKPAEQDPIVAAVISCLFTYVVLSLLFSNVYFQYYDERFQARLLAVISICVAFVVLSRSGLCCRVSKAVRYIFLLAMSGLIFGGVWLFLKFMAIFIILILALSSQYYGFIDESMAQ